jgi:hypothetical protein
MGAFLHDSLQVRLRLRALDSTLRMTQLHERDEKLW